MTRVFPDELTIDIFWFILLFMTQPTSHGNKMSYTLYLSFASGEQSVYHGLITPCSHVYTGKSENLWPSSVLTRRYIPHLDTVKLDKIVILSSLLCSPNRAKRRHRGHPGSGRQSFHFIVKAPIADTFSLTEYRRT